MFKILCIDGGGMRGVIPAKVLALVEEALEHQGRHKRLCDCFDLICGTSTGSIIATGLALGMSARNILRLYRACARDIFPPLSPVKKLLRLVSKKPLYERQALSTALRTAFDQAAQATPATLGHAHTRLCIPTYDLTLARTRLLRNYASGEAQADRYIAAADAALASSAAPGYFNSYSIEFDVPAGQTVEKRRYAKLIDNGAAANTPLLTAYFEAVETLGVPPQELAICSLGTGDFTFDNAPDEVFARYWFYYKPHRGAKAQQMAFGNLLLTSQSTTADTLMHHLQGSGSHPRFVYQRLQYDFGSHELVPFDTSKPKYLDLMEQMGKKVYEAQGEQALQTFFT